MVRKKAKRKVVSKRVFSGWFDFFTGPGKFRFPAVTLVLVFLILGVYFWLSEGGLFIHPYVFFKYAFHAFLMPYNAVSYVFVHTGPVHLFSNLVFLLVFGALAEQFLERLDPFFIFIIGGLVGGIAYTLYAPGFALVGSSAGIFGLFGAVLMVRPKAAVVSFVLLLVFVNLFLAPALSEVEVLTGASLSKAVEGVGVNQSVLEAKLSEATGSLSESLTELVGLRETRASLVEKGLSTAGVDARISVLESRVALLRSDAKGLDSEVEQARLERDTLEEKLMVYEKGVKRELTVPVAFVSHIVSTIAGALYVLFIRRGSVFKFF